VYSASNVRQINYCTILQARINCLGHVYHMHYSLESLIAGSHVVPPGD